MQYRRCGTDEAAIGMNFYLTDTDGTGGAIKVDPEDFIVDEISSFPPKRDDGHFTIAKVTTKNWETNRLVRLLAREMRISREKIGFAGTKDKRAITSQLMSFECPPENISFVGLKDITFSDVYRSNRKMKIGDLIGNAFTINVRNCELDPQRIKESISETVSIINHVGGFPNYFGIQRFGVSRPITHLVGEAIIRGDLKKAVDIYLSDRSENEGEEINDIRRRLGECNGDYAPIIEDMPKVMGFEKIMASHLVRKPEDYMGAINEMPPNLQMMFTHAYQSYLFNQMLSERMERGIPLNEPVEGDIVIPVDADGCPMHDNPVFTTAKNIDLVKRQVRNNRAFISITLFGQESLLAEGEMGEIERKIIEKEHLKAENFLVPGLPHCTSGGSRREVICKVNGLESSVNEGGYTVKFSLSKGSYATCLMREFMKSDVLGY